MGNQVSSNILKDQQLEEFRKLSETNTDVDIPTSPQNRQLTDKKGFVIVAILLAILLPFLIYTLVKSDIGRLGHGVDNCGNLCGVNNPKIDGIGCSGADYRDKPYEQIFIKDDEHVCTNECPFETPKGATGCVDDVGSFDIETDEMWTFILQSWWKFVIIIIITSSAILNCYDTSILCFLIMLLFRFIPGVVVWGVTIVGLLMSIALPCLFWSQFAGTKSEKSLALAVVSTIFGIAILILFIALFKRIKLIAQLYKETTKAIFAMPLVLLLPILTQVLQLLIFTIMIVCLVWMGTAAVLEKQNENKYVYQMNWAMKFAMTFDVFVTIWALQFLAGCQYMVVAGSIVQWFFKKNQTNSAIVVSFTNTMRFHLGTVAFGAFILTIVAAVKFIVQSLLHTLKLKWLADCVCGNIEALLKFLSKNAYVETAIHGQSFFRSGRRAAKLLLENASSVIALNSVGDFVLGLTQLILLVISTAIAYGIFSDNPKAYVPTILCFFMNLLVVASVFAVFTTAVDTLFVCFCEDKSMNDGETRSYFMSLGLMKFVETSKQFYDKNK